jgi:hypothetical protein
MKRIYDFIKSEMQMSQVYQPVMIRELLRNNGQASVKQIAQAILDRDPTQIEYFSEILGRITNRDPNQNQGITVQHHRTYR